jgi:predicted nucleic acid-binding protein
VLRDVEGGVTEGVYSSTATIQEILFWLYNQGLRGEMVEAANALSRIRNLEWVPVTPEVCLRASVLVKHYGLSPFDGYHAATALGRDGVVLSSDHSYDRVTGLSRVDPWELTKT